MIKALAAFIKADLTVNAEQAGGTVREHLLQAFRQTGVMPVLAGTGALLPVQLFRVWDAFESLSNQRPRAFNLGPIPFTEVQAWMDYTGTTLSFTERMMLHAADNLFLNEIKAREAKK